MIGAVFVGAFKMVNGVFATMHSRGSKHVIRKRFFGSGSGKKYSLNRLYKFENMYNTILKDRVDIVNQILPFHHIPFDIRLVILEYAGMLRYGRKSMAFVIIWV